ncbi:MAG: hypothetical protein ACI4JB_03265 [Porcipelethomonas sp.]
MNKFIAFTDIIGTILIIVLSILDHLIGFGDKFYFIMLIIGLVLLVPVTVREAYSIMKMKQEKDAQK